MSRFLDDAGSILEAAAASSETENCAILMCPDGGLHMVMGSDWPLHSLQTLHGASTAYHIHRDSSHVRVEGRSGSQRCTLEIDSAKKLFQQLLGGSQLLMLDQSTDY